MTSLKLYCWNTLYVLITCANFRHYKIGQGKSNGKSKKVKMLESGLKEKRMGMLSNSGSSVQKAIEVTFQINEPSSALENVIQLKWRCKEGGKKVWSGVNRGNIHGRVEAKVV